MNQDSVSVIWDEIIDFILLKNENKPATVQLISTLNKVYKPKLMKAIDEHNKLQ